MQRTALDHTRLQPWNAALILQELRRHGRMSKAGLARAIGVSPSTAGRLVEFLMEKGMVVETEIEETKARGRRGMLLSLNPAYAAALGVELTDRKVDGRAVDFSGQVLAAVEVPISAPEPLHVIRSLVEAVWRLQATIGGRAKSVTIATGGVLEPESGLLLNFAGRLDWEPFDLAGSVAEQTRMACRLVPRTHAAAIGELRFGGACLEEPVLYVNTGPDYGMGTAIVVEGRVLGGADYMAGNLGHLHVQPEGKQCSCGSRGCLATIATPAALIEEATEALARGVQTQIRGIKPLTYSALVDAAMGDDKLCVSLLDTVARYLGIALSHFINVINPATIVLAGEMAYKGEYLLRQVQRTVRFVTLTRMYEGVRWQLAKVEKGAAALGAASAGFDPFFEPEHLA